MRIALLGPYPPYRGGIAHFAAGVQRGLTVRGHEVEPVTFSRQYPSLFFPGKTEFETGASDSGGSASRMLDSINPFSWYKTARHISGRRPDAVVYSYWLPFFAPAYGCVSRAVGGSVRHIAIVHNALPHERRPGDAALTKFFFRPCSGFLAMSAAVEADVKALAPSKWVRRAPHPVYDTFPEAPDKKDARRTLGLPEQAPVALFFGFVRQYKGLEVLLRALPEILRHIPDFRLVIAGEFYDDREPYQRMIDDGGFGPHVQLHDRYIPSGDVGRYFAAADIVIQPYITATQSGVAQIAYHFNRPLIVTDVGGLAEVVPHERAGLVIPPGDPGALAAATVRFYSENLSADLERGVVQEKKKYGWDPLIDALEALIGGDD